LFGVLDITDDAKALNDANQKVFPSIEIEPNFAGKGYAYLMGCALTDSPAAIATDRLSFNRSLPGVINLTADMGGIAAAALEPAEEEAAADAAAGVIAGFFSKLGDKLGLNTPPAAVATAPAAAPAPAPAGAFDPAQFTKDLGETLGAAFTQHAAATTAQIKTVLDKFTALETRVDTTASPQHQQRPPANGQNGNYARTDC
jgi:hypothetical protein